MSDPSSSSTYKDRRRARIGEPASKNIGRLCPCSKSKRHYHFLAGDGGASAGDFLISWPHSINVAPHEKNFVPRAAHVLTLGARLMHTPSPEVKAPCTPDLICDVYSEPEPGPGRVLAGSKGKVGGRVEFAVIEQKIRNLGR